MVVKIAQRYIADQLVDSKSFFRLAALSYLTVYAVHKVCTPIFDRLSANAQSFLKVAVGVCVVHLCIPDSPLAMTVLAVSSVAIAIYQSVAHREAVQKHPIPVSLSSHLPLFKQFISDSSFVIPEEARTYLEPLHEAKAGKVCVITGKINLSLDCLAQWTIQQYLNKFSGYTAIYVEDDTKVQELLSFLRNSPKTVVFTQSQKILNTLPHLPQQTYVLGFVKADRFFAGCLGLPRIHIEELGSKAYLQLLKSWVKSNSFTRRYSKVNFEEEIDTFNMIIEWVGQRLGMDLFFRDTLLGEFALYIQAISSEVSISNSQGKASLFFSYLRTRLRIPPHILISLAEILREKGIDCTYEPSKDFTKPAFLIPMRSKVPLASREQHRKQLRQALGGIEKPHALVSGCNSSELKQLLQEMVSEEEGIFEWDMERMLNSAKPQEATIVDGIACLIDYLCVHPKTLLYISSISKLTRLHQDDLMALLEALPPETHIVCSFGASLSRTINYDSGLQVFLEQSKRIHLMPLTAQGCRHAVQEWIQSFSYQRIYREVQFQERSLDAAIKMAFLFMREEDEKLNFIKDLIERAIRAINNEHTPVTIEDLWKVFVELHPVEKDRIEQAIPKGQDIFSTSNMSPVKSLNVIARALNQEFKIALPTQPGLPLEQPEFLENLNEKFRAMEKIAVGNDRRLLELTTALSGLDKTNVLLKGAPGIGKTTLIESLAWMIEHNEVNPDSPLYGKTIYSLQVQKIMKGTRWVGILDERIDQLISFLEDRKSAILFIDEIQQIIGAGASKGNEMGTIAQGLKPFLLKEDVMVIGATTSGEAEKWLETDELAAFKRRFIELNISPPNSDECFQILTHIAHSSLFQAKYPGIIFDEQSIRKVIELTNQIRSKVGQPDRSKDLMIKVAIQAKIRTKSQVTEDLIEAVFNDM